MDRRLHELIGNSNYLSSAEVCENLSDKAYCDDLASVFGAEFVSELKRSQGKTIPLQSMATEWFPKRYEEYTQIYMWGGKGSGKTYLLGSLFAAIMTDCKRCRWYGGVDAANRISVLRQFFLVRGTVFHRLEDSYCPFPVYHVDCVPKGLLQRTAYPLTFIEADPQDAVTNPLISEQLESDNNKIHLFCFDCSAPQEEQQRQANSFCRLLQQLKGNLQTSVGIYVVVTKADTMLQVPAEYRHNAAQTLITAKYWPLWQQVVDACYEMDIYDSTPIPFSVGDVVLKDIVTPDLTDARSLLRYPIFLKSYRRPNLIKKVLWNGGWKRTVVMLTLVLALIGYALYAAYSIVSTPPLTEPQAYDFERDFIGRVEAEFPGNDFLTAKKAYDNLRYELIVENKIRKSDGSKLQDVTRGCDSVLTNSFAFVLLARYRDLYGRSDWHDNTDELTDAGKYVDILCARPVVANTLGGAIADSLQRMKGYHDGLAPLEWIINNVDCCTSWDDVEYITNTHVFYLSYPYTNDTYVRELLNGAVERAHYSYSDYLDRQAARYRQDYFRQLHEMSTTDRFFDFFTKNLKGKYRDDTEWLRNRINHALIYCSEEYESLYRSAEETLTIR